MSVLQPVTAAHELPYRRIASLKVVSADTVRIATGWFFGDFLVVTAGHVMADLAVATPAIRCSASGPRGGSSSGPAACARGSSCRRPSVPQSGPLESRA